MNQHTQKLLLMTWVLLSLAMFPGDAEARRDQVDLVPHGDTISCLLCHTNSRGDQTNAFGAQVESTATGGDANWSALAELDADGDEYTNGYELGDPDGTWKIGDPYPEGEFWHPSDFNDNPCGNDIVEGPETCDGPTIPTTCEELGYAGGELTCTEGCRLDETACEAPTPEPDAGPGEPDAGPDTDASPDSDMGTTDAPQPGEPAESASSDESCSTVRTQPESSWGHLVFWLMVMAGLMRFDRKQELDR